MRVVTPPSLCRTRSRTSTGGQAGLPVFFQQIPAASEKAYLEVGSATHFLGNVFSVEQARSTLAWFKRYIDDDTRYSPFLCPPPSGGLFVEYRHTCPD